MPGAGAGAGASAACPRRWHERAAGAGAALLAQGLALMVVLGLAAGPRSPAARPGNTLAAFALPAPQAAAAGPQARQPPLAAQPAADAALRPAPAGLRPAPAGLLPATADAPMASPPAPRPTASPAPEPPAAAPAPMLPTGLPASARAAYLQRLWQRIMACRPAGIGLAGRVTVAFTLDASGRLLAAAIARPSGMALIDRAGLLALRRAAPFPAPPAGERAEDWRFEVEIHFGEAP